LRRARTAAEERLPGRSQQATLRALGDARLQQIAERYIDAWERGDVDAILAMLVADANFTMPPLPTWYRGRDAISTFLTRFALQDRWRLLPARANGQLAFACYAWDVDQQSYTALSLDVLTLEDARAALATEVTSFVTPSTRGHARERFAADVLERFGLPDRLD
jgi:RNA polymerase sigma-70 factor, ECF subfamily